MNRFFVPLFFAVASLPFLFFTQVIPRDHWLSPDPQPIQLPLYSWEIASWLTFTLQICCLLSIPMVWMNKKGLYWSMGIIFMAFFSAQMVATFGAGPLFNELSEWSILLGSLGIITAVAHLVHRRWRAKPVSLD